MQRIKLAICMKDAEYQSRFTNYLFGHYKEQFELHGYTSLLQFMENVEKGGEQILLIDEQVDRTELGWEGTIVCLTEDTEGESFGAPKGMHLVKKYQDADRIVEGILSSVGEAFCELESNGIPAGTQKTIAVYSLSETEYQLPFVLTMASILGESQKTLVLDLQENSGLQQLFDDGRNQGLEELMVMAEGGKYSKNRLFSCICHKENWDYIYPAKDTQCIGGLESKTYFKMLELIRKELHYDILLVNFGTRFLGFFQALERSQAVFLLKRQSILSEGREQELERELIQKGFSRIMDKLVRMEIPFGSSQVIPCERLAEEWKWNEFGDRIRRSILGVTQNG
ncbi:MAG: hypothetical protein ACI4F0_02295 [Agathobacter sp.]